MGKAKAKPPAKETRAPRAQSAPEPPEPPEEKEVGFFLDGRLARLPDDAAATPPDLPVREAILEAARMVAPARKLRPKLSTIPDFDLADADDLPGLVEALRRAETRWQKARKLQQAVSLVGARKDAEELRRKFYRAARYRLRKNAEALAEIDRIAEGDGLADLVQDLGDIAAFLEKYEASFVGDVILPKKPIQRARALAATLKGGKDGTGALDALAHRNLVFHALQVAVDEVREAARYLLSDRRRLAPFLSEYEANRKRRSRARKTGGGEQPPADNAKTAPKKRTARKPKRRR